MAVTGADEYLAQLARQADLQLDLRRPYIVMAYIVMAYIVMAYIVMADLQLDLRSAPTPCRRGRSVAAVRQRLSLRARPRQRARPAAPPAAPGRRHAAWLY